MLIEQLTYTLRPATVRSYLGIYEADGLAIQTRHDVVWPARLDLSLIGWRPCCRTG